MKKISYLTFLMAITTLSVQMSCNSAASISASGLTIKGKLANAENLSLYFDKINFDNSNFMYPKADIDANGNFQMHMDESIEPGIYRLRIGAKKSYIILDGTESVLKIEGDLNTFDKYGYTIKGAPVSENFIKNMNGFATRTFDKSTLENYIKSESNGLAAAFAAMNIFNSDPDKVELLKDVNARLQKQLPGSKYSTDFATNVSSMEARIAQMRAKDLIKIGKPAPEIELEDPNGKKFALSDLKGKIVLLDFWASWCGPCRKANPHVVETYKKYKKQGFTVYSVSLDGINPKLMNRFKTQEEVDNQLNSAKKRWEQAIAKDQLEWEYHVSDLQYWNSIAAKTYGVRSIPQTFLIDRDGNIAALNPRFTLEEEIKKLL